MGVLEMVLLGAGAVIFIASFCIPVKKEELHEETKKLAEEEVKNLVSGELENVRTKLTEMSDEEMQHQIEKSERSMERISNEKIMAVGEYSDTVLEEIHKNHQEVVFLYDMLNDKQSKLTETLGKADKNIKELLQEVKDSEITVRENLAQSVQMVSQAAARAEIPAYSPVEEPSYEEAFQGSRAPEKEKVPEEKETPDFVPFKPEKVEVVPKRTRTRKSTAKKKTAASETAEAPVAEGSGEQPRTENADVELLLSGSKKKSGKNSNERILELHKAGKSNMAIAKELGLGIGEVKLVIDLYEGLR